MPVDPLTLSLIMAGGSMLGQTGAGMLGSSAAKKESDKAAARARTLRSYALAELGKIDPLSLPDFRYSPEEYGYISGAKPISQMAPQDVAAQTVAIDPVTRMAQLQALQDLKGRADEGLTAQDKYNFMMNRRKAEQVAQGREGAIQESMRRRGMSGTGLEAVLRAQAGQASTENLALSQAAQAAENARMRMQATQAAGGMAGQIRGQDFTQARTNADILNQMAWKNSERARLINNMNINQQNRYASQNIDEQRKIQGMNTAQRNQAELARQRYGIEKSRAEQQSLADKHKMMAQAQLGGIPGAYAEGAAGSGRAQHMWGTIGQAFPTAANIGASYMKPAAQNNYMMGGMPTSGVPMYGGGQETVRHWNYGDNPWQNQPNFSYESYPSQAQV